MSSLKSYSFPPFYACYLLKSLRTPRSFKNYIGFTRDPIYRLHQHNGNCTGGARGTALHRPWAMQLLVHGFPSHPAALIFEYAWRNPHKSKYTHDEAGFLFFEESGKSLGHNIMILQKMIRLFPFSKWPLHVKLFTEEAACYWFALASTSPSSKFYVSSPDNKSLTFGNELLQEQAHRNDEMLFPPGFTYSIKLNGVSGLRKLPRSGPRSLVTNTPGPYLGKTEALISSKQPLLCSICAKPVKDLANDHLGTAICTHADCISVAHLQCLAKSWLDLERSTHPLSTSFSSNQPSSPSAHPSSTSSHHSLVDLPASALPISTTSTLSSALSSTRLPPSSSVLPTSLVGVSTTESGRINDKTTRDSRQLSTQNPFGLDKGAFPRGGTCHSCGTYTLWGDIINGCFMRSVSRPAAARQTSKKRTSRRTKNSVLEDFWDSGAGSELFTQFDVLTLQEASRKRKSRSRILLSKGRIPRRKQVLAQQKAELELAKRAVGKYREIIRSKQESQVERLSVMPKKRGRPRKIAVTAKTTTVIIPLKRRGPGRPKKSLATSERTVPALLERRGPGRPKKTLTTSKPPVLKGVGLEDRTRPELPPSDLLLCP